MKNKRKISKENIQSIWEKYYIRYLDEKNGKIKIQISERESGKIKKRYISSYDIEKNIIILNLKELEKIIEEIKEKKEKSIEKAEKELKKYIKENKKNIDSICLKKLSKKEEKELLEQEEKTYELILNNKNIEELNNFEFKLKEYYKSGIKGKYIVETEVIYKKEPQKKIEKEFFCSVSKKDKKNKKIYLHLIHLEKEELENCLCK